MHTPGNALLKEHNHVFAHAPDFDRMQSRTSSLRSLPRSLDETSASQSSVTDSILIGLKDNTKWAELKYQGVRSSFISKLGMRNSTASPIFSDFKSDLSRVARSSLRRPKTLGTMVDRMSRIQRCDS